MQTQGNPPKRNNTKVTIRCKFEIQKVKFSHNLYTCVDIIKYRSVSSIIHYCCSERCYCNPGVNKPRAPGHRGYYFCTMAPNVELPSCYSSDTMNFEVVSKISESLFTPVVGFIVFCCFFRCGAAQLESKSPRILSFFITHYQTDTIELLCTSDKRTAQAVTCATHNKHNRRRSMPSTELETATPAIDRPQNQALDRTNTRTGIVFIYYLYFSQSVPELN